MDAAMALLYVSDEVLWPTIPRAGFTIEGTMWVHSPSMTLPMKCRAQQYRQDNIIRLSRYTAPTRQLEERQIREPFLHCPGFQV
jgi:hypothetical protein